VAAAKKATATAKARPDGMADARVQRLLAALRKDPELAPVVAELEERAASGERPRFGSNGLKVGGKLFALFTQGTLVVKLPRDRAAALAESGVGEPFDPGHGRLMKEWLTLAPERTPDEWLDLAREAHAFVKKTARRPPASSPARATPRRRA
jgi:hypothetical protein